MVLCGYVDSLCDKRHTCRLSSHVFISVEGKVKLYVLTLFLRPGDCYTSASKLGGLDS
jgi:hypothetical protein